MGLHWHRNTFSDEGSSGQLGARVLGLSGYCPSDWLWSQGWQPVFLRAGSSRGDLSVDEDQAGRPGHSPALSLCAFGQVSSYL